VTKVWQEIGDRVFVRRYRFYDQEIGLVLGDDQALVVDTRISHRQGQEILDDVRQLTALPVAVVVNTHAHNDHCFGNRVFRPCTIWGQEGAVRFLRETGEAQKVGVAAQHPKLADDVAEVVLDEPDRTFADRTTIEVGGRPVELRYLGRGHTDHDAVIIVPDVDVLFAGDLLEGGAPPYFGDGFPMDWPATVERLLDLVGDGTSVVPGHGDVAGRAFVTESLDQLRAVAALARRIHTDGIALDDAMADAPWGGGPLIREALERGLAQLRGELDRGASS
jgi:glyoxylase-like metal-dependent hydrolase (beta-lactamase superfamily II)